jgi:hypothetical protein
MTIIEPLLNDPPLGRFLAAVVERFAIEGVPVCAIARGLQQPSDTVREVLKDAKALGRIVEFPREDWPPGSKITDRLPAQALLKFNATLAAALMRHYQLTRQQSNIFAALLRRQLCTRETLLDVMKQTRADPNRDPDPKLLDVVIHNLRLRLSKHDITVVTIRMGGYTIEPETRRRVLAHVQFNVDGVTV